MKAAVFLHERWHCKAVYYHLSFQQNETLITTTGFEIDPAGSRGWRGEGAAGAGGVDERCLLWALTRWSDGTCSSGWRGPGPALSPRLSETARRRGKAPALLTCCLRRQDAVTDKGRGTDLAHFAFGRWKHVGNIPLSQQSGFQKS